MNTERTPSNANLRISLDEAADPARNCHLLNNQAPMDKAVQIGPSDELTYPEFWHMRRSLIACILEPKK